MLQSEINETSNCGYTGRVTASQIATASATSFSLRFT